MKTQYTTCVVCDCRTTDQHLNESYDCYEYVCSSCVSVFYKETALPKASDCEDCNLKESDEV